MVRMSLVIAMAALSVAPAYALPAAQLGLRFEQNLALSSPLSQDGFAAVESALSTVMTETNGMETTATILESAQRRLQAGSTLTITYIVACGSACDTVAQVCHMRGSL